MTDAQEFELQCSTMPSVTIYSDGSFKPDLNTGGYGTIMTCNGHSVFLYGGFIGTSNNAMELQAVLSGIEGMQQISAAANAMINFENFFILYEH